jgi:hypothetical protein
MAWRGGKTVRGVVEAFVVARVLGVCGFKWFGCEIIPVRLSGAAVCGCRAVCCRCSALCCVWGVDEDATVGCFARVRLRQPRGCILLHDHATQTDDKLGANAVCWLPRLRA